MSLPTPIYPQGTVQIPIKQRDARVDGRPYIDADTMVITVKPPVGDNETFDLADPEIVKEGTGLYRFYYLATQGHATKAFQVAIVTTVDDVQGSHQLSFRVEPANT